VPDRIVRDELMRSHRYVTLSSDTVRLFFVHCILTADSLGNLEATTTSTTAMMGRQIEQSTLAKWIAELDHVGIIRAYLVDDKQYVHIPRFRQRLRYIKGKHPRPPSEVECKEISSLLEKVRPQSDHSQTTVSRSEVKRSEVKRSEAKHLARPPVDNSTAPTIKTVLNKLAVKGEKPNGLSRDEQLAFVAKNGKA
jgi:hypothetical protein